MAVPVGCKGKLEAEMVSQLLENVKVIKAETETLTRF
jgi:hypothetical protein